MMGARRPQTPCALPVVPAHTVVRHGSELLPGGSWGVAPRLPPIFDLPCGLRLPTQRRRPASGHALLPIRLQPRLLARTHAGAAHARTAPL